MDGEKYGKNQDRRKKICRKTWHGAHITDILRYSILLTCKLNQIFWCGMTVKPFHQCLFAQIIIYVR